MLLRILLFWLLACAPAMAAATQVLEAVRVDQRLGAAVPTQLAFTDATGRRVRLAECLAGKPTILSLVYFGCPNLCTEVLNGLVKGIDEVPFRLGRDFNVVTLSIDPGETPTLALEKERSYLRRYKDATATGWHCLTGDQASIHALAEAVGFHYAYDPALKQYAHPSALVVLTPEGKVARYMFGLEYPPLDLRLGLLEASEERIGSPVDRVLLRCYAFDPRTGRYSLAIMALLRGAGLLTVLGVGWLIARQLKAERRRERP